MDVTEQPTWHEVSRKIVGLWPRYEPTDAERALISQRLQSLRMRWLDAAVDQYRCESASTVFRLAELLAHYQRIAATGEPSRRAPQSDREAERVAERQAVERDADTARTRLSEIERTKVANAVRELRSRGWLGARPLPSRIAEWPSQTAMMVLAFIEVDEGRSRS